MGVTSDMNDVLLVDDEQIVLQNLSAALDWSEFGFQNVRTASNALDALNIVKKYLIDLIILDIQMPQMTGLEMLKILREQYPDIHCILISAYSKFEYAKEALCLNVENYLLKPIDINELRETVAHAADNIAKASASSHNLFERNLLERWLYGRITSDELMEHSQYTHYNVLMRHYFVVILSFENRVSLPLHALTSAMPKDIAAYPLREDESTGILLCGGYEISEEFIESAASFLLKMYPDIKLVIGSRATGSNDVSRSMAAARHTLEFARLSGRTGCLSSYHINWTPFSPEELSCLNDIEQNLLSEKQIRAFISRLAEHAANSGERYCDLYAHICLALHDMPDDPDLQTLVFPPFSNSHTQEAFEQAVYHAIHLYHQSKQQSTKMLSPITQRVIHYIRDNLSSSISIKHFCEQTNMNSTYIGRLFKEELNMYFSEYVCILRINKAKLLLENTTLSVSDIARQVGIYDVSYFVQCFKKQERTSPMKYRQALLKNTNQ